MMFCGHCGAPASDEDRFCNRCGARFVDDDQAPAAGSGVPAAAASTIAVPRTSAAARGAGSATEVLPATLVSTTPYGEGPPRARPFLIGAAAALALLVGAGMFLLLRHRDDQAKPGPTTPPPTIVATTNAPTTIAPSTVPATTSVPSTTTLPTTTTVPATSAVATTVPTTTAVPTTAPAAPVAGAPTTLGTVAPITVASTAPASTVTGAPTTVATTVAAGRQLALRGIAASDTRGSTNDGCGHPTTYEAPLIADGKLETAWMANGDGRGAQVTFTLAAKGKVTQVGLVPGYAKVDPCTGTDRFRQLRRVAAVRWTFDDGTTVDQRMNTESPVMQYLTLAKPMTTSTVRLTILDSTNPEYPLFDYTPVSEASIA